MEAIILPSEEDRQSVQRAPLPLFLLQCMPRYTTRPTSCSMPLHIHVAARADVVVMLLAGVVLREMQLRFDVVSRMVISWVRAWTRPRVLMLQDSMPVVKGP